ncbi:inactive peptidyl-prolyl cis-trans isomerase FKBP6 [Clupea harengus]|uniref:peptidylprolyl isomerase n=1 Tax=Clupea harengus TaxID=7950 RepID=A0A6P8G635_CLUHA|nr:inactive peptidyl-prolyl cis-trans isomerase FKBP6 [Clupea harengus]XP_031434794.1 inactive peptidyl-prolyl cis-trans isomerase FKBP6 [Clupea harengus]XP_042565455.1 inactive peptidyl-prolyl cis-trans isomerase FKBP6 [Clupea harengus]
MHSREAMQRPFERLAVQMQDILGDEGILKRVIQPGDGPLVPRDASVSVNLSGYLEYCDDPFETTKKLKHPRMMKLGRDVTLWGLEVGLLTMKKGELAHFLFKPKYAYGEMGCPPLIPSSATVFYEVHVIDFLDSAKVDEFFALAPEEQATVPLATVLEVVSNQRFFGNRCFRQSRYEDAKDRYKQGITLLQNHEAQSQEDKRSVEAAQVPILLNLSLTYFRLERPTTSLKYGQRVLEMDPNNAKALYRCGQAYLELGDYEKAADCLTKAQVKMPFNKDINKLLMKLQESYSDCLGKEREMCSKMFANLKVSSRD